MTKENNSEKAFLDEYRMSDYERPSVTADIALFKLRAIKPDNFRKEPVKKLSLLLPPKWKRNLRLPPLKKKKLSLLPQLKWIKLLQIWLRSMKSRLQISTQRMRVISLA